MRRNATAGDVERCTVLLEAGDDDAAAPPSPSTCASTVLARHHRSPAVQSVTRIAPS